MATREEILSKQTHKEDGIEVERRVYYTLAGEQDSKDREQAQLHRLMKAVSLLTKKLRNNGTLSEEQLDDILLEVVM